MIELTDKDEILLFVAWKGLYTPPPSMTELQKVLELMRETPLLKEVLVDGQFRVNISLYIIFNTETRVPTARCRLRLILDDKWSSEGSKDVCVDFFRGELPPENMKASEALGGDQEIKKALATTGELAFHSFLQMHHPGEFKSLEEFKRVEGPLPAEKFVRALADDENFKVTEINLDEGSDLPFDPPFSPPKDWTPDED